MFRRSCLLFLLAAGIFPVFAQTERTYDSLYTRLFVDQIPSDSIRVNALYKLSELILQQNHPEKAEEIEKYFNEALVISIVQNYSYGYDFYFKNIDWFYDEKVILPIVKTALYDDYISKNKVKSLHTARSQLFNFSFHRYYLLIYQSQKYSKTDKIYILWLITALAYIDQENFQHANDHLHMAISGASKINDSKVLADAYAILGYVKFALFQNDSAGFYFERALSFYERTAPLKTVVCLNNAGEVLFNKHQFRQANGLFQRAVKLGEDLNDSSHTAWSLHNQGRALMELADYDNSIDKLSRSLKIASRVKENDLVLRNLYCLSTVYDLQGRNSLSRMLLTLFVQKKDSLMAEELDRFIKTREDQWQTEIGREITRKETEAWQRRYTTLELNKTKTFVIALALILIIVVIMMGMLYRMYRFKEQAARYLDELNRSRDRFYAIISHDLRSPLISIGSAMEHLKKSFEHHHVDDISRYISKIIQLTDNTRFLLDNLLIWLKGQKGLIQYNPEIVDVTDLITFNVALFRSESEYRKITMIQLVDERLKLFTDRNMLDLMIRNLLNNALKFTGHEGKVTISAFRTDSQIIIQVADTGRGIGDEELKRLLNQDMNGKQNQTGLGLVLIKDFLPLMAGTMQIESNGQGTGACFRILFKTDNLDKRS